MLAWLEILCGSLSRKGVAVGIDLPDYAHIGIKSYNKVLLGRSLRSMNQGPQNKR